MIELAKENEKPVKAFLVGLSKQKGKFEQIADFSKISHSFYKEENKNFSIFEKSGNWQSDKIENKSINEIVNECENEKNIEENGENEIIFASFPSKFSTKQGENFSIKNKESSSFKELKGLIFTLGYECGGICLLNRLQASPKFGMGSGKALEICEMAKEAECDCIVFDFELSPSHQRNWEKQAKIPVLDRQEIILRIFASRAKTKEAVLQVELAKLEYSLPRLAHSYGDLARQRGGSYGSKGSGETQLELDKRQIEKKIAKIKQDLEKVVKERNTMKKQRQKIPLPRCALVGYTNAGKSSLLNALTGADVFVEDKLFATLDPTTRRLKLNGGGEVLLSDTVGFIGNLPHSLVNAFKSTLEEATEADLLLLVLDASDFFAMEQYKTVKKVLEEIGAENIPTIIALNKIDNAEKFQLELLKENFCNSFCISAKQRLGFNALVEEIASRLLGKIENYAIPLEKTELLNLVRKNGNIIEEKWLENKVFIKARTFGKAKNLLEDFITIEEIEEN